MKSNKNRITDVHNNPKCDEEIIQCSKCHNKGHHTRHLNTAKNASIDLLHLTPDTRFHAFEAVNHACFTENKDIGRNNFCYTKQITVGVDEVYLTIRLKTDKPVPPEFVTERQREAQDFEPWIYDNDYDSDPYNKWVQDD